MSHREGRQKELMVWMEGKISFHPISMMISLTICRYSPCRSPLHFRSVSSLSVSSPDIFGSLDTSDKLQEMEELIKKQKEIITQQKNVIENQTEKIEELETSVRNITHEVGSFEEID